MNEELIRYRREKSRETLEDARILFRAGRLFSALNRIYYALFYEVMALLLTKDLSSARHTGIRAMFNEHFVRTGKVSVESGRFFSRMYDFRQKGDYADFVQFEEAKIKEWLVLAECFINDLDQVIEKELNSPLL
ncbi:MAG: HEPN domain-containing protein [Thermodesulfobacteriota bacterium]|nr:HEPN domain-containing protein [Thermodesulfobacteriota bacterium]